MFELKGKTEEEITEFFTSIGEKPFRGNQLFKWIYNKLENDFSNMTNISKELRNKLKEIAIISELELVKKSISENNNTEKFLFRLSDGNFIESVIMRYDEPLGPGRVTACISTQAGCSQKCAFCASGLKGLVRNLSVMEIVDQIVQLKKIASQYGEMVTNIVIMGIGEPLANYDNLVTAVKIIKHGEGLAIGRKHIAISTSGLVPEIKKLAHENLGCKLAVSLNAYNNEIRTKIMPVNKRYPMAELLEACRYFQDVTDTRITFEYILIKGLNDSIEGARKLGEMIADFYAVVNLIPLNCVEHFPYEPSDFKQSQLFLKEIEKYDIKATLRNERGRSISAACGQLRLRHEQDI